MFLGEKLFDHFACHLEYSLYLLIGKFNFSALNPILDSLSSVCGLRILHGRQKRIIGGKNSLR